MTRRPSLIYEVCTRFDMLKQGIGVSRHAAKRRLRRTARREGVVLPIQALSTGWIHSDGTLATYKAVALRYVHWVRDTYGVRTLAEVDAGAERFVSAYLEARLAAGDSPYTLATTRSGLRMFYRPAYDPGEREMHVRRLGADVALPKRRREGITRSRGPAEMDADLALYRWCLLEAFASACGLRRRELLALTASAVRRDEAHRLVIDVENGKGGRSRTAPVISGGEHWVLEAIAWKEPEERIFTRIPVRFDVQSCRRIYAMNLYSDGGRYPLPPAEGRLPVGSVNSERALFVAEALGHSRIDVMLRHYLR